ncbi:MAG: DsrE/DsrF/DrsH-like family protein, partial [Nitrososphaerales archaeon]
EGAEKVAMVVNSGDYDRVSYALSIAKVACALGMEVHMLFTYGGLNRLVKGRVDELGSIADTSVRERLEHGLAKGTVAKLSDDMSEAKKLGLKIYACVSAMGILNVTKDELIEEVDQVMGLSAFLDISRGAMTYYI